MKINSRKVLPFLYLFPAILILGVFVYYPIIENIYNSFLIGQFSNRTEPLWGWNIIKSYFVMRFLDMSKNNALYALVSLIGQVFFGLIIAAVLESKMFRKHSGFFRTTYFLPSVMSFIVVGLLWYLIYNPIVGPFNKIIALLGINTSSLDILGDSRYAIWGVMFASQWMYFGYMAMLLIVGIQKFRLSYTKQLKLMELEP